MKNTSINQSLIELEENLNNLESARSQVEKVSEKSEKMVKAFNSILNQIELLQNLFSEEKNNFSKSVVKNLESFNSKLTNKSDDFIIKSEELNKYFSNSVDDSIKKLNAFQKSVDDEKRIYEKSIGESLDKFEGILNNKANEFIERSSKMNQYFANIIHDAKNKLDELKSEIDEVIIRVNNTDFERNYQDLKVQINKINQSILITRQESDDYRKNMSIQIELLNKNQKQSTIQTFVILILGFLSILLTLFLL